MINHLSKLHVMTTEKKKKVFSNKNYKMLFKGDIKKNPNITSRVHAHIRRKLNTVFAPCILFHVKNTDLHDINKIKTKLIYSTY